MIQTGDALIKNWQKPAILYANFFYRQLRAFLNKLDVRFSEHEEEQFPTFALLLDPEIPETMIISYSIMSLVISTTSFFDYHTGMRYKN